MPALRTQDVRRIQQLRAILTGSSYSNVLLTCFQLVFIVAASLSLLRGSRLLANDSSNAKRNDPGCALDVATTDQQNLAERSGAGIIANITIPEINDEIVSPGEILDGREQAAASNPEAALSLQQAAQCAQEVLKVYVYDIPEAFSFGLLQAHSDREWGELVRKKPLMMISEAGEVPPWPERLQLWPLTHSGEHFLTADILLPQEKRASNSRAVRVMDPEQADVFFVPIYASRLFYLLTQKVDSPRRYDRASAWLLDFLDRSPWWHRKGGRDHVFPLHHVLSLRTIRNELKNSIQIVIAFAWYPVSVSNITKDVVAPMHQLVPFFSLEEETNRMRAEGKDSAWDCRPTLLFFRGGFKREHEGRIRKKILEQLWFEKDVQVIEAAPGKKEIQETTEQMRRSKFCLHMAGDTPTSARVYDILANKCVMVVVSDHIEFPFESTINYSKLAIFVSSEEALRPGGLTRKIRSVTKERWTAMWKYLHEVSHHFQYKQPATEDDAVNMIWREVKKRTCKDYGDLFKNRNERLREVKTNGFLPTQILWP